VRSDWWGAAASPPCRRGVGFRAEACTRVDAFNRFRYGARIDATPRGCSQVPSAGVERALELVTPKGSRGKYVL
jgi:hypothetical protein